MERLFVTGDTHRNTAPAGHTSTFQRLSDEHLLSQGVGPSTLGPEDTILVAGDAGWCWDGGDRDAAFLDRLQARSEELGGVAIACIDGNHDNFAAYEAFPLAPFRGGSAHRLRGNVFHVPRGEVLSIGGRTVFCLGGASSPDRHMRTAGFDWWPEEIISWEQEERARAALDAMPRPWAPDLVVTHTAPPQMVQCLGFLYERDPVSELLFDLYRRLDYGLWAFGHMHVDRELPDYRAVCLFDSILRVV